MSNNIKNNKFSDFGEKIITQNAKFTYYEPINENYGFNDIETIDLEFPEEREKTQNASKYFEKNNIQLNYYDIERLEEKDGITRIGTKDMIYEFDTNTMALKSSIDVQGKNTGIKYNYDGNGNIISNESLNYTHMVDKNLNTIYEGNSFENINFYTSSNQYGASQSDVANKWDYASQNDENIKGYGVSQSNKAAITGGISIKIDATIESIIKNYFPNATEKEMKAYLDKVADTGCAYTAYINNLFVQFKGKEDKFLETFGFPMYNVDEKGNIKYNYEPLIVDLFSYTNIARFDLIHDIENILLNDKNNLIEDITNKYKTGAYKDTPVLFSDFLKERYQIQSRSIFYENVEKLCNDFNEKKLSNNLINKLSDLGCSIYVGANNYDLYTINADGSKGDLYLEDGSGHAMTITGVTNSGDYIVSTWGEKMILPNDLTKIDEIYLFQISNMGF